MFNFSQQSQTPASSPFGGPSFGQQANGDAPQQQQQQQQPATNTPGAAPRQSTFESPMTLNDLGGGNRSQNPFAQQQQQQQQPSPFGQQQQPTQTTSAWTPGGMNNQYGQQSMPPNQQQYPQSGSTSTPQQGMYGYQGQQNGFQGSNNQSGSPSGDANFGQAGQQYQQQQQQQSPFQQSHFGQQQPSQQQSTYLPGYLSRFNKSSSRPYMTSSSSSQRLNATGERSPPKDHDSSAVGPGRATTPDARSNRDGHLVRRTSIDGPASPVQGFSSSFFAGSSSGTPGLSSSSRQDRSQNIFGAGGLRGKTFAARQSVYGESSSSVITPGGRTRERSASHHLRKSGGGGGVYGSPSAAGDVDEDDAPPFEALADSTAPTDGLSSSSFGARGGEEDTSMVLHSSSPPAERNAIQYGSLGRDNSTGTEASSSPLCTLILYGFPASLVQSVLHHFSSIGHVVAHEVLSSAAEDDASSRGSGPTLLQITYSAPHLSLHALRRSGELVAGAAYVGVRLKDDGLHSEMILYGLNSKRLLAVGGQMVSQGGSSSNSGITHPSLNGLASPPKSNSAPPTASSMSARPSTPSSQTLAFGRPLQLVDSPAAALRSRPATAAAASGTASPFGKVGSLFGTPVKASGTAGSITAPGGSSTGTPNGVMGRIGDAIFGW